MKTKLTIQRNEQIIYISGKANFKFQDNIVILIHNGLITPLHRFFAGDKSEFTFNQFILN